MLYMLLYLPYMRGLIIPKGLLQGLGLRFYVTKVASPLTSVTFRCALCELVFPSHERAAHMLWGLLPTKNLGAHCVMYPRC